MKRPRPRPLGRRVAVLCALSAGVAAVGREPGPRWDRGSEVPAGLPSLQGQAEEANLVGSGGDATGIAREDEQQYQQRQRQQRHERIGRLPHIGRAAASPEPVNAVSTPAQEATHSDSAASEPPPAGPHGVSSSRRALSASSSASATAMVSASASASTSSGLSGSSSASATA
ncbi:unnamed protein product, partial [Scytosiphon promiscuus]